MVFHPFLKWGITIGLVGLFSACDNANQLTLDGASSSTLSSDANASSSTPNVSSSIDGVSSVIGGSSSLISNPSSSTIISLSSSSIGGVSSSDYIPSEDRLANITKQCGNLEPIKISSGGTAGHATRYWDCCKPTCSWRENVDTTAVPFRVCKNCDINNQEIEAFEWAPTSSIYWSGYQGTKSGCDASGIAYSCYSQVPYAKCDNLAYGYAAAPSKEACGRCYQLDFDGGTNNGANQIKEAHKLLKGKTMIVMASNTGSDVGNGQFDLMIPGGGLGIFDGGCGVQWGVDVNNETLVGSRYGGLLTTCQKEINNYDAPAETFKSCVRKKCDDLFGNDPKTNDLWEGCVFFVDWMHTADNPTFTYKEVECPQELLEGYTSTKHPTATLKPTW